MSTTPKTTAESVDDRMPASALSPQPPPEPDPASDSLLAWVMRAHPALTREEAIADILEFGGNPFEDPAVIHAWRRRGLPAYTRVPIEREGPSDEHGRQPAADPTALPASASASTTSGTRTGLSPLAQDSSRPDVATDQPGREDSR